MKYDFSQEVANEMLENADRDNDRLSSEVLEWQGKYGIAQAEVDNLRRQRDELTEQFESLREEMKSIAIALGRSKTDGESDCDWHDMAGDVEDIVGQRDELRDALERITDICERVDGWESFPSEPLDDCYKLLAKIKEAK